MPGDNVEYYAEPDMAAVRVALRVCHQTAPESAKVVEEAVETLLLRNKVLQSADPFRSLVLSLAGAVGKNNLLIQDVRTSMLIPLAEAERDKQAILLIKLRQEEMRINSTKGLITPQVLVVIISAISGIVGTITAWFLKKGE
jgi:hypothetical protein